MNFYSHQLLGKTVKRAQSLDDKGELHRKTGSQLPSILTPTFGDWKIGEIQSARPETDLTHPKISRNNPLYDKFSLNEIQRRTPIQSLRESQVDSQANSIKKSHVLPFRDLRSEGQVQRQQFKENYGDLPLQGKRYNSTGKNNRREKIEDSTESKSSVWNNNSKDQNPDETNFSSADKVQSVVNSDEDSPQQPYQNPNMNKFTKIPKRALKFIPINSSNQLSPKSLRGADTKIINNSNYWNLQSFSQHKDCVMNAVFNQSLPASTKDQGQKIDQLRQQLADIDEQNLVKAELIFNKCCSLLDQQKAFYESVLKNNSLFYKYSKTNKTELVKQKTKLRENYELIYPK